MKSVKSVTNDTAHLTSDELITEVVKRSADDRPALRVLERKVLKARLREIDNKSAADRPDSDPQP